MQSDMPGCEMDLKLRYRLTLVSGMVECLCFAGVVFGYASLVFVLKEEGYFRQQCDTAVNASDCTQQDEKFSLVFTVASFLNNFLTLFNGYVFDRFGTLVTRLLGISLYTTGTLLISFSSAGISEVLFPALSCIAVGGMLLLLSNMQVGNLFAAHRSTIITLYNGAFDSSAAIFLILKVLHEHGVPLYSSFHVLSVCSVVHLVRTFLLLPRTRIPYPLPQSYSYGVTCAKSDSYNVEHLGTEKDAVTTALQSREAEAEEEVMIKDTLNVRSFWSCVLSWLFARHLVWLSIMQLRHYLFIGTLNPMLNRLGGNDPDLVSQYTNAFAITQLCGVLCAPWNGLIMDRHKDKPLAPGDTEQEADLRSSSLSLLLTAVQCLLFSVCASIPLLKLQYITFILQFSSKPLWEAVRPRDVHVSSLLSAAVSLFRTHQRATGRRPPYCRCHADAAHSGRLHSSHLRLLPLQTGSLPKGCQPGQRYSLNIPSYTYKPARWKCHLLQVPFQG
ncbi:equilibrative nucleobase transporter 1-like isoform X1 [Synchiropus splendidus]|uniref:equilibrative nucleobase transporter 1-like isoform X1 n=1 Tax=Synchiropus splendidus TaxID=270530 RepID=UPI00237E49FE|nr:equilibrative nucleobase transporter 1-like isoform X1 [Synchiropus splendidus]